MVDSPDPTPAPAVRARQPPCGTSARDASRGSPGVRPRTRGSCPTIPGRAGAEPAAAALFWYAPRPFGGPGLALKQHGVGVLARPPNHHPAAPRYALRGGRTVCPRSPTRHRLPAPEPGRRMPEWPSQASSSSTEAGRRRPAHRRPIRLPRCAGSPERRDGSRRPPAPTLPRRGSRSGAG